MNPNLTTKSIKVVEKILSANDKNALILREKFQENNLYVINLMSSPGSGKTTLLENLSKFSDFKFCVIEGDLQTNRDADRLESKGIKSEQICTGSACHLEAKMVENAFLKLQERNALDSSEFLIIENIGNLVCPASYNLGADLNIVLLSTPEGDDKVLKYPSMFLCADLVLLTKWDLKDHFNFNKERVRSDLDSLKSGVPIIELSVNDEESLKKFINFIYDKKNSGYHSSHSF